VATVATTHQDERPTLPLLYARSISLGLAAAFGAVLAIVLMVAFVPAAPLPRAQSVPEDAIEKVYRDALPGVVSVVDLTRRGQSSVQMASGSGFVIDREGHVLTNYHLVEGVRDPGIVLGGEDEAVPADVVGEDPIHDLALLKVSLPSGRLHPLRLGDSSRPRVGQRVVAIGSPFGLARTLTTGVVSYVGRPMTYRDGYPAIEMIQTDAAINPGNSGGPLLNLEGEVVGIVSASIVRDIDNFLAGSVGVGFAVPAECARRLLPEMKSGALVSRPWLGVVLRDVKLGEFGGAESAGVEGAMVVHTLPGSAAEVAGLRYARYAVTPDSSELEAAGDVIVAIDGVKVKAASDVAAYLAFSGVGVGDVVTLRVVREAEAREVSVRLRARDATQPDAL